MSCKHCGGTNHTSLFCFKHPRIVPKGMKVYAPGGNLRHDKKWQDYRKKWFKKNPPNHEGYYECYLCHQWIPAEDITLDHVIPRSRRNDLRYEDSNIRPCCWTCNGKKGSKVLT